MLISHLVPLPSVAKGIFDEVLLCDGSHKAHSIFGLERVAITVGAACEPSTLGRGKPSFELNRVSSKAKADAGRYSTHDGWWS